MRTAPSPLVETCRAPSAPFILVNGAPNLDGVVVQSLRPTPRHTSAEFHQPHDDMIQRPWTVALPPLPANVLSDAVRGLGYQIQTDDHGRTTVDLSGGSTSSRCTAACEDSVITISAERSGSGGPTRYRHERAALMFLRSVGVALRDAAPAAADVVAAEVARHESIFDSPDRGLRGDMCWSADKPDLVVKAAQPGTPIGVVVTTSDVNAVRHLEMATSWLTVRHEMEIPRKGPPTYSTYRPITFHRDDGTTIPLNRYGASSTRATSAPAKLISSSDWSWGAFHSATQLDDGRQQIYSILSGVVIDDGLVQHGPELMALWRTWLWLVRSVDPYVEVNHIVLR